MDSFFTVASFATLAGSAVIVLVVVNTIRHVFNWGPRWFGFIVSIAVSLLGMWVTSSVPAQSETADVGILTYFLAILNGFLIYCTAFGIQNTVVAEDRAGLSAKGADPSFKGADPSFEGADPSFEGAEMMGSEGEPVEITFRSAW